MKEVLKLAIQKKGRLSERSLTLIKDCGISFIDHRGSSRLKSRCLDFPLELLFLRDDDICGYVADGIVDVGIIGENIMLEQAAEVVLRKRLGFSRCRLVIAVPKDNPAKTVADLAGLNLATSYPRVLGNFLKEQRIDANIHEISGSVEIAPGIGLADGICDIVSSGSTLASNGLRELHTVLDSEAVLIGNPKLNNAKTEILEQLEFRIDSVQRARSTKYIVLNAPNYTGKELYRLGQNIV